MPQRLIGVALTSCDQLYCTTSCSLVPQVSAPDPFGTSFKHPEARAVTPFLRIFGMRNPCQTLPSIHISLFAWPKLAGGNVTRFSSCFLGRAWLICLFHLYGSSSTVLY